MAECYQCGNGFGFRGKKINKNEIKKEIQKLLDFYREYTETHEILGKNPEIIKEILGFRKQSATFDIFSNKMSDSDLICEKCFSTHLQDNYTREIWTYNILNLSYEQKIKFDKDYPEFSLKQEKEKVEYKKYGLRMKIIQESKVENSDGSEFSYVCNWCKKTFKKSDSIFSFSFSIHYDDTNYSTAGGECSTCKDVRKKLYSDKLGNLLTERRRNDRRSKELSELIGKARRAISEASSRANFDDFAGDRTDKIITQNRHDDLVMQSKDMALTLSDMEWSIGKESERLAEEHFFKNKLNNVEDKDNPKTETPLEILKVRLAKGEITLEEFKIIKENLDE